MASDKAIHFGHFVRLRAVEKGFRTLRAFAGKVGITERQLFRILKDEEPASYDGTLAAIAAALGYELEEFDREWRSTPVSPPKPKAKGPRFVRFELPPADLARLKEFADNRGIAVHEAARNLVLSGLPRDIPDVVIEKSDKVRRRREPAAAPPR